MVFFVYLLECRDYTYYCGYTNDLEKRIITHNKGIGSKYTKRRRPVKLIYFEEYETRSLAMKREYAIKQFSRREKEELIKNKAL
ncbi:MAG: GIY-YIG nuclease family protein [Candidatus ainarchaeum sp.]|nr:GIY-YIG nuclease family protein [Candidatus ainarchaeum sp.]